MISGLLRSLPLLLLLAAGPARAADPCLACHEQKTPGVVRFWKESAHAGKGVGCADCHGRDQDANHRRTRMVGAEVCGSCHAAALKTHRLSRHAVGLKTGQGCTRNLDAGPDRDRSCSFCHREGSAAPIVTTACAMFLAQTPQMQRQGCTACHRVEIACDTCHTKHGTDPAVARDPGTCGVCHMGPDHPQFEMWETSLHGVLARRPGGPSAPTCITCHLDKASHNVSRGIATGLSPTSRAWKDERELMVGRCSACHSRAYSGRSLADADGIALQSLQLVAEAQEIVAGLARDGLLAPPPADRPAHPLFGKSFVIGPAMLYENISSVESRFFRLRQFHAPIAFKGAFHQNPDYSHWYGNAPLKLTLSEIRSEAALLRTIDALKKRVDLLSAATGTAGPDPAARELRLLLDKRLKGEISEREFERQKKVLLDRMGF